MDLSAIINKTPDSIQKSIAQRIKTRRLELNLTQRAFSKRAGMGYDAYRSFENTGDITLKNLILCAIALDDTEPLNELFVRKTYQSIEEILLAKEPKKRRRGTRND